MLEKTPDSTLIAKKEFAPKKTKIVVSDDLLSKLFEDFLRECLERIPRWFAVDGSVKIVCLKLSNESSYFDPIEQKILISVSFSEIALAADGAFSSYPDFDSSFRELTHKIENDTAAMADIPVQIIELATRLQQDKSKREKTISGILPELVATLHHERGHALFDVYKRVVLEMQMEQLVLEEMADVSYEDVMNKLSKFASDLKRSSFFNLNQIESVILPKVQEWSDAVFKHGIAGLSDDTKEFLTVETYLGFLEEIFIRIVLKNEEGLSPDQIASDIKNELFLNVDLRLYGFGFRPDWSILQTIRTQGVQLSLDQLMKLYTKQAGLELAKERLW